MSDLDYLIGKRAELWDDHPIITESAVLPTPAVQDTVARVLRVTRKRRASLAQYADPQTGKSSCIRALVEAVQREIPGCGVVVFEAVKDKQAAEGRLLLQILKAIKYTNKVDKELAGKRDQVNRALLALSGPPRQLLVFLDEAQALSNDELEWLKAVVNGLVVAGVKVTTVLFGQRELKARREEIYRNARSDLGVRFMKKLREFVGCRHLKDFQSILNSVDCKSEYPAGSGWTYTQLLLPRAFKGGFRCKSVAEAIWVEVDAKAAETAGKSGVPMEIIASIIAQLFIHCRPLDAADLIVEPTLAKSIVKAALEL